MAASAAFSMFASASTICGPLPPSSSTRFLRAASRATCSPALVEPVKTTEATSGFVTSADPTSPRPCTTFSVPGGKPASWMTSANMLAQSGACSDGFQTVVQPTARPYTIGIPAMSTGKFQGVTAAMTPTGSCTTMMRLAFERSCVDGRTFPAWRRTSSDARRKWSAVYSTISSRDSRIVLPTSFVICSAISSARSMQMAKAARQSSTRSRSETLRQAGKASAAARTAASTWVAEEAVDRAEKLVRRRAPDLDLLAVAGNPLAPDVGVLSNRYRHVAPFSVVKGSFARPSPGH